MQQGHTVILGFLASCVAAVAEKGLLTDKLLSVFAVDSS